ncbi:MAG: DUF4149 domain-containing protein [Alphaproteobacteria bacterium]|nr:DUF4149 domain-containing protein [Alphaproteobacteria bacterium]
MLELLSFKLFGVIATAAVFGGMVFFAFVFAPLVFTKLPGETAGGFIRQVFPVYYLTMACGTAAAGVLALSVSYLEALALAAVGCGFIFARQQLMPAINRMRDAQLAGAAGAEAQFTALHRLSVLLNGAQLLTVLAVLVRLTA